MYISTIQASVYLPFLCGFCILCVIAFLGELPINKANIVANGYLDEGLSKNENLNKVNMETKKTEREALYLECIITCVNYSDFLSHTLLWNKKHFDNLIVVGKPDDWHTRNVCNFHHVRFVETDAFGENFDKAKGINAGFEQLKKTGWVAHIDADIILSPRFREILNLVPLDKSCIYGIDRVMVDSPADWMNFIAQPTPQHDNGVFVQFPPNFRIGTRIYKTEYNGYVPIGYFQLFHGESCKLKYPEAHDLGAARTDMLWAVRWPREKRQFIPELYCYHLSSENTSGVMGKNWNGRVSQPFTIN